MNAKETNQSDRFDEWSKKSDTWLIEVLCGDDPDDRDLAMLTFHNRYDDNLKKLVTRAIPYDWIDDVVQDIWMGFYIQVKFKNRKITKGVPEYLSGIAYKKRASAVDKLTRKREIEADIPITGIKIKDDEKNLIDPEKFIKMKEEKDYFHKYLQPIIAQLSDYQRVIWMLRCLNNFQTRIVGRLLGKKIGTIDTQYHYANKALRKYFLSEEHAIWIENYKVINEVFKYGKIHYPCVVIDRFSVPIIPDLNDSELNQLGIPAKNFGLYYRPTLMITWGDNSIGNSIDGNMLYLSLNKPTISLLEDPTRQPSFWSLSNQIRDDRYKVNASENDFHLTMNELGEPWECLINVTVIEKKINLLPHRFIKFNRRFDPALATSLDHKEKHSPLVYVAITSPRIIISVTVESLIKVKGFTISDRHLVDDNDPIQG